MTADKDPRGLGPEDSNRPDDGEPNEEGDTEGQMMLPDGSGRWLAQDRERDIRKHLSGRQLERQARDASKRR